MRERRFMLCFHDLRVSNCGEVLPLLFELKEELGEAFSVLVIPSVEGAGESEVEAFRTALSELQKSGFELALHGFRHSADLRLRRSLFGRAALRATGGEAEFAGLSEGDSERLLERSLAAWRSLTGARAAAFVPPTWHANDFLLGQVLRRGLVYESRLALFGGGRKHFSPVTSFAGIPRCLEGAALAFGYAILKSPVGEPRIALHPCDFPRLKAEIFEFVRTAKKGGKLLRYADFS